MTQTTQRARIRIDHSFKPEQFYKLAENPMVEEIDNFDMDEGRFFVHLKTPYYWYYHGGDDYQRTMSFGSVREAKQRIKEVNGGAA